MCERRKDFKRFFRFLDLFLFRHMLQCPHIVEPVRKFDQDHAHVFCHGDNHLPVVFSKFFFFRFIFNLTKFRDAIDEHGHVWTKIVRQLL